MITLVQRDALMAKPAIAPNLPPEVTTFDCIDFGGYCARGYNPCQIAGHIPKRPLEASDRGRVAIQLKHGIRRIGSWSSEKQQATKSAEPSSLPRGSSPTCVLPENGRPS